MKVKDWLETSAKFSGWPAAEYDQVIGGYIFPIVFRTARIVVDIDRNTLAAPLHSRSGQSAALRDEAAQEQGFQRFSVLDATIWSTSARKALDAVRDALEEGGFIRRVNPVDAIKAALYHKAARRSRRTAQTLRDKTRPRRMRARTAQVPD